MLARVRTLFPARRLLVPPWLITRKEPAVEDIRGGETTYIIQPEANALPVAFGRPWNERQRIITSVCNRLVGDLDSSLHAIGELCSSLDSRMPGDTAEACD